MMDFKTKIKNQIDCYETELSLEKDDLKDDNLLLQSVKSHARRDQISIDKDFCEDEDCDDDDEEENVLQGLDADKDLDSTTKIYLKKIKSKIIPWLKKE